MFSPSLDHSQDALYAVEFVRRKSGDREGPWALMNIQWCKGKVFLV